MDDDASPFHPSPRPPRRGLLIGIGVAAAIGIALWVFGQEEIEQIRDSWRAETPHEEYLKGLHDAGLAGTALTRSWIEEAAEAVERPQVVELPFQEETFIGADDPEAVGYRFHVPRGQRVRIAIAVEARESPRVFLDVFRVPEDPTDPLRPLTELDRGPDGVLTHEPTRSGDFIVRVQPELLRSGRFRITVETAPALAFPVEGRDTRAILSFFGADREAGRRTHAGVDIFAPRGTPVLASAPGRVNRVELTNLGGKVVWVRDNRGRNLYYAHLDSQYVRSGMDVEEGDTVGFVGNSGNARTTPPHLHYGIYVRGEGAVDPFPYLEVPERSLPELVADLDRLGSWGRVGNPGIRLRAAPTIQGSVIRELAQHTAVQITGAAGSWYRVRLPDGSAGYLSARLVDDLTTSVTESIADSELPALDRPTDSATLVDRVAAGASLPVLGRFEDYLLVRSPLGRTAWVRADAVS